MRIINKRVNGNKMEYQVESNGQVEWKEYADLTSRLELIMEYEKELKERKASHTYRQPKIPQRQYYPMQEQRIRKQPKSEVFIVEDQPCTEEMEANPIVEGKSITELIFLDKMMLKGKAVLRFTVYYNDGTSRMTINETLRKYCPQLLIDFYESNVVINQK